MCGHYIATYIHTPLDDKITISRWAAITHRAARSVSADVSVVDTAVVDTADVAGAVVDTAEPSGDGSVGPLQR